MQTQRLFNTSSYSPLLMSSCSLNKTIASHLSNEKHYQAQIIYQQNVVVITNNMSFEQQMHIYELRKHQELNLVRVYSIEPFEQKASNFSYQKLKVLTQKITFTLDQIQNITFQTALSILYSSCIGFECLYKYFGYFEINDYLIGLNINKQIRVWINKQWAKNEKMFQKRQPFGNIQDIMVRKLIEVLEKHIEEGKSLNNLQNMKNKTDFWSFALLQNLVINIAQEQRIQLLKTINFDIKQEVKLHRPVLNFRERTKSPTQQNLYSSIRNMYTSVGNKTNIGLLSSFGFKPKIQYNQKHNTLNTNISPVNQINRLQTAYLKSKLGSKLLHSVSFNKNPSNISFACKNNQQRRLIPSKRQSEDLFYERSKNNDNKTSSMNNIAKQIKNLVASADQKILYNHNSQNINPSLQKMRKQLRQYLGSYADEDLQTNNNENYYFTIQQNRNSLSQTLQFQGQLNLRKNNKKLVKHQQNEHISYLQFFKKQNTYIKQQQSSIPQSNQQQTYLALQSYCPSPDVLSPLTNNLNQNKRIQQFLRSTVPNFKTIDQSICAKTASRDDKSNITLINKAKQLKESLFISGGSLEKKEYRNLQQRFVRLNNLKIKNTLTQSINITPITHLKDEPRQSASKKQLNKLDLMILKRNLEKESRNQQLAVSIQANDDPNNKNKNIVIQQDD